MCKFLPIGAALLTLMIMTGCLAGGSLEDRDLRAYQNIHEKYSSMKSYCAEVRLTVRGNKTEQVYELTQKIKMPDQALVTINQPASLAGTQVLFSQGQVNLQQEPGTPLWTMDSVDGMNYLLLHEFFALYYQSEDTVIQTNGGNPSQDLLLETAIFPKQTNSDKVVLRVDAKKLIPKTLTVYDLGGNVRLMAEFLSFSYNSSLPEEIFQLPEP